MGICCMAQETHTGALYQPRGVGWGERGAAKSLQSCPTLRPHRRQPNRLPGPWDSPGKNTGVGCHFLLQCMQVKSESEVAQSCSTLRDPMDCSLPGSSVHGILQARVLEWGAIAFSKREGREVPKGGDICIPMADSCWGLIENNKILSSKILQ